MSYLMIVWLCVTPSGQAHGVGPGSEDPVHPLSRRDAERLKNEAGDLTAELSSWYITEIAILVGVVVGSFVLITITISVMKKWDEHETCVVPQGRSQDANNGVHRSPVGTFPWRNGRIHSATIHLRPMNAQRQPREKLKPNASLVAKWNIFGTDEDEILSG